MQSVTKHKLEEIALKHQGAISLLNALLEMEKVFTTVR